MKRIHGTTSDVPEAFEGLSEVVEDVKASAEKVTPPKTSAKAEKASGEAPEASGKVPAKWAKKPKSLFLTDEKGELVYRNGKPVLKNRCRPRKPKPGELLLDGSTFKGGEATEKPTKAETQTTGRIIDPTIAEAPTPPTEAAAKPSDGKVQLGPEAGAVAAGLALSIGESVTGEKPTSSERDNITRSCGQAFGGARVPATVAVVLFVGAYLVRVLMTKMAAKRKEAKDNKTEGKDAHSGGGANGVGKDSLVQAPYSYGH